MTTRFRQRDKHALDLAIRAAANELTELGILEIVIEDGKAIRRITKLGLDHGDEILGAALANRTKDRH